MKTNFKKLALAAGITAGMAGVSIPAHAIMVGDPGEAALVPLAVHSPGFLNTVVKITVPKSVGNDIISNFYTAPNSSPTNGTKAAPGPENPGVPGLVAGTGVNEPSFAAAPQTSFIHWYWLNVHSEHEVNSQFPVSQDDVAVFDWAAVDTGNVGLNRFGYLVFVTEMGNQGKAANFSFFTDAWLVVGNNAIVNTKVSIPSLPMSDGPDGTTDSPTIANNVVEISTTNELIVRASPLVTGNRTIWSDGKSNNYVFDLPLANSFGAAPGVPGARTVSVVWNDRNAGHANPFQPVGPLTGKWASIPAFRFTNNEVKCSGKISLPDQLNVNIIGSTVAPPPPSRVPNNIIVPSAVQEHPGVEAVIEAWANNPPPLCDDYHGGAACKGQGDTEYPGVWNLVDDFTSDQVAQSSAADGAQWYAATNICTPPLNDGANNAPLPATNLLTTFANDAGMSGGFVKVVAPEPADNNLNTVEGAAVYFTLPIFDNDWGGWSGWPLFLGDTLLGHPAGAFTTATN